MTPDDPYHLDMTHHDMEDSAESPTTSTRRWLGIMFECCSVYARLYPNKSSTAYEGPCPRCHRRIKIPIGPGGTDNRFFRAS